MKSRVKDPKDHLRDDAIAGASAGPAQDSLSWIRALASDWEDRRHRPEVQEGSSGGSRELPAAPSRPLSFS
ncbi:MAG TPA: hypothetical protein VKI41_15355 [Vicinamibacteria bacterium]|nr:hypothetical protein [Vicinamibacteria bacterium]